MNIRSRCGLCIWLVSSLLCARNSNAQVAPHDRSAHGNRQASYCNPIDLSYRFQLAGASRREAADPTVITFHGEYWLFPSKSGGYWHSPDLLHWSFVEGKGYPVEEYAPTALVMNGKVYLTSGHITKLYVSDDPSTGIWTEAADFGREYNDPALFLDDDGRLYVYYGVTDNEPLYVTELDPKNGFQPLSTMPVPKSRPALPRGWEVSGDNNSSFNIKTWIEGAWMNKHEGRYYLQYAAPGTQYKAYGDGVLVSDKPMGPFSYAPYSPFSFKPSGFIAGAGHSSTFAGLDGRFWHMATMTISIRHNFERRLGLFPTHFTKDGELVTDTYLGDYPHYVGGNRGLTGWMLLSRKKAVTASSALESHPAENAVDEEVRTWWSAKSGNPNEWLQVDLGATKRIEAIQINFADEGSTTLDRCSDVYQYIVETSSNSTKWSIAVDHHEAGKDSPHDYEVLPKPINARYVRITNVHSPNGAKFSISDLRIFGNASIPPAAPVSEVIAERDADSRHATIHWRPSPSAEFYVVRLGTNPEELTQNFQVYDGASSLDVRSLNAATSYYVAVDAVNERGITAATKSIRLP